MERLYTGGRGRNYPSDGPGNLYNLDCNSDLFESLGNWRSWSEEKKRMKSMYSSSVFLIQQCCLSRRPIHP